MRVVQALWVWYPLTAALLAVLGSLGTYDPRLSAGRYVALHVGLAALALLVRRCVRAPLAARVAWSAFTAVGLPCVFSSIGWVLPMIHPEPFEWTWIALDRALCGRDPIPLAQATLTPLSTDVLLACYVSFYLVPAVVLLAIAARRDGVAFDRGLATVVFGFQLSYLGYLLWPTLGPNRLGLWEHRIEGLWLAGPLDSFVACAETNWWDCFPSGHTMLSLLSLVIAWRHVRAVFWFVAPVVACIVYATVALRYHYVSDVLAGIVGVGVAWGLSRSFGDARDAAPAA